MFRTLATRLTASYVFAAFVLVIIVFASVTAFALSVFGINARAESASLARQVPDEVRLEVARAGSLRAAAGDIVRHIARPGVHVVLFGDVADATGERRELLAATGGPDAPDGHPVVFVAGAPARVPPGSIIAPHAFDKGRFARMRPYPFGLNLVLKLEPRNVDVPGGRLTIFPDPEPLARTIDSFWLAMLPIGLFVICAAWFLGRFITLQALRPLVETTASLNRFGAGDFTPRPIVTTDRSEIGELVKAYNAAVAQVGRALDERTTAERNMRQFIADAGHELRTPLTVIMGFIDVMRKRAQSDATPAVSVKIFDTMLAESRRMKALIETLILLARLENARARERELVDLGEIASRVVAALGGVDGVPRVALAVEAEAIVRGYENELYDAVCNLVENALKYAPQSIASVRVGRDGADAIVEVADRGPGIDEGDLPHVFDRFYRGADRGGADGFGLGLAIAKRAAENAGGTISVASAPGCGANFTIRVPRAREETGVVLAV
ncbi:MAG: hypothetical protein NVS3B17_13830 [Vulcanimicrobiaceae bacterium]